MVPSPSARNQSSDHSLTGASSLPPTSWFHSAVHFFEPASARLIFTFRPSGATGCPPAGQVMLSAKPGWPVSDVMYFDGSAACSFLAAATYSSHVFGTVM